MCVPIFADAFPQKESTPELLRELQLEELMENFKTPEELEIEAAAATQQSSRAFGAMLHDAAASALQFQREKRATSGDANDENLDENFSQDQCCANVAATLADVPTTHPLMTKLTGMLPDAPTTKAMHRGALCDMRKIRKSNGQRLINNRLREDVLAQNSSSMGLHADSWHGSKATNNSNKRHTVPPDLFAGGCKGEVDALGAMKSPEFSKKK